MKININTNISEDFPKEIIDITICASSYSDKLKLVIENIENVNSGYQFILGKKNNAISLIPVSDIIKIYSKEQNNFCETVNGVFLINKKIYDLEENLDTKKFIRISNSCIVNIKYVKNFDLSSIGKITINLLNTDSENVSKRRISKILKFLKERSELL